MRKTFLFLTFFPLIACQHNEKTTNILENEKIDTVYHNGEKYLIPIPKNYCRYDNKNKKEKAISDLNQDLLNYFSEVKFETIATYADCVEKEKFISDEIKTESRVIQLLKYSVPNSDYITRKALVKDYSTELKNKNLKEFLTKKIDKSESFIAKADLEKRNLSKKKKENFINQLKYDLSKSETIKNIKDYDDYGSYLSSYLSSLYTDDYSGYATTKINHSIINIKVGNFYEKKSYSSEIAKKNLKEVKEFTRKFVEINNKDRFENDFKEYVSNDRQLKIYTPDDFFLLKEEKVDSFVKKAKERGLEHKRAFIRIDEEGNLANLFITTPINNPAIKRDEYIDQTYERVKQQKSKFIIISKEQNGIFLVNLHDGSRKLLALTFGTTIRDIPIIISVLLSNPEQEIKTSTINRYKEELVKYVNLLEAKN